MPKATDYSTNFLKLLFNNTAYANVGDAGGLQPSGAPGSLYVSLHTDEPGLTGDQTVNEVGYTGYARIPVARSGAGWTVAAGQVVNAANIVFGACTGAPTTATHFGIGTDLAGAGQLLYSFPLIQTYYDYTAVATSDLFTVPGHALLANDPVCFITNPAATTPGNLVIGTVYYVKTVAGNDITISATFGGLVFDINTDGAGLIGKIGALAITAAPQVTPEFLAGQLILSEK